MLARESSFHLYPTGHLHIDATISSIPALMVVIWRRKTIGVGLVRARLGARGRAR